MLETNKSKRRNYRLTKINKKSKSGVTLIALSVTIIVLMILAGISINGLLGEDGIIAQATWAAFATEMQSIQEQVDIKNTFEEEKGNTEKLFTEQVYVSSLSTSLKMEILYIRDGMPEGRDATKEYYPERLLDGLITPSGTVKYLYYIDEATAGANQKYVYDELTDVIYKVSGARIAGKKVHSYLYGCKVYYGKASIDLDPSKYVVGKESHLVSPQGKEWYYSPDLKGFDGYNTSAVYYNGDKELEVSLKLHLNTEVPNKMDIASGTYIWYDYSSENKIWANIKTKANGIEAWWVWIPRYAYKELPLSEGSSSVQEIDVVFINTDNQYYDVGTGEWKLAEENGYIVHPAFTQDSDLKGIWMSKYTPSYGKNKLDDYDMVNIILKPNLEGYDKENTYLIKYNSDGTYKSETKLSDLSSAELENFNKDKEWYDYTNKIWANIKTTANGLEAWWVWIPRYAYKLPEDGSLDDTEIIFVGLDNKTIDKATYGNELPEGFIVHPAFSQDDELDGIWMSKYAPSYVKDTTDDTVMADSILGPNLEGYDKENTYLIKYNSDGTYKSETKLGDLTETELANFNNNKEWYDYPNKIWANIKTVANGIEAWWVWVPRYAYKIPEDGCADDIEIIFIGTDNAPIDKEKYGYSLPEGFVVHPAFEQDTSLQGIWMSKYAPSEKTE